LAVAAKGDVDVADLVDVALRKALPNRMMLARNRRYPPLYLVLNVADWRQMQAIVSIVHVLD